MFSRLFQRAPKIETPQATGIQVFLLQTRLKRHSKEELNQAMQKAWHRPHDPVEFFATIVGDEGGLFKLDGAFYPIIYKEHRLTAEELQDSEIPPWADHGATTRISAEFPGGVPEAQLPLFYGFLGMLIGQLISDETRALFFKEASVFVPATPGVIAKLREPSEYIPADLLNLG